MHVKIPQLNLPDLPGDVALALVLKRESTGCESDMMEMGVVRCLRKALAGSQQQDGSTQPLLAELQNVIRDFGCLCEVSNNVASDFALIVLTYLILLL